MKEKYKDQFKLAPPPLHCSFRAMMGRLFNNMQSRGAMGKSALILAKLDGQLLYVQDKKIKGVLRKILENKHYMAHEKDCRDIIIKAITKENAAICLEFIERSKIFEIKKSGVEK